MAGKEILDRIKKDVRGFGWAAAAILLYYLIVRRLFGAFCPFLLTTGIPCAGCGLTRAAIYLVTGQFKRAVFINPMIFPILGLLLYCGFWRYIKGRPIKYLKYLLGFLVVVMLLYYGFCMWKYFPYRVPYVYHANNLLSRLLPGYEECIRGWRR